MILKLLLVIGVIGFVYFIFIKKKPAVTTPKKKDEPKQSEPHSEMIECAECGVYCELDETILSANRYYCSDECVKKS